MAWLIQNPGKNSRTAIVLQSRQRIGKNRFTDVIAELTSRYSCSNITNIDELTGRFNSVVENKMFAVLNEMMNYNDSKKGVATVMKSIISDITIRINEKNQPRRTAENVMNIIYITNADMPVQLNADDRRHLVCACKTVHQVTEEHKEDVDQFNELSQRYIQEQFENGIRICSTASMCVQVKWANDVICLGGTKNGTEQILRTPAIFVCHLPYTINEIIEVMCWRRDHYF
ncbi:MAG: hypothetical protein EZS28_022808 [Streblomastix strix]|uniref:NrS-1 polymerase-like helicase domain-containing protein n=1 Tax=Streblomastix strix TaxID=222440 RepID=A0A5J4VGE6_9EUKA|nr:MAG: hypothetical protein EZS28_022808 [Streblomastix strix]